MARDYTFLFEVSPIKPDGTITTLQLCSEGSSSKTVYLDNKQWLPLIETAPDFEFKLMSNGRLTFADVTYGTIEFICSDVYGNEEWSSYDWTQVQGRCWYGPDGAPWSEFKRIFEGKVSGFNRSDIYGKVELLGAEADIQVPALYTRYTGIGASEGGPGIKGNLKPRAHGFCFNVELEPIDMVNLVYQVHGYGAINNITGVYEFGQSLAPSKGNAANYFDLINMSLGVAEWATCLAEGLVRLGGQPEKKLTCDIEGAAPAGVYAHTAKQIIQQLIREVSPAAQFGTFPACFDAEWCFYGKEETNVWDIVYQAANDVGGYIFPDGLGTWQAGDFYAPVYKGELRSDRSSPLQLIEHEELQSSGPISRVSVGHTRVWSTHTQDQLSETLVNDAIADAQAALEAAQDAHQAALQAAADALVAKQRYEEMGADGKLDRVEKKQIMRDFAAATQERPRLLSQGLLFGVLVERDTFSTAYDAWKSYLEGLNPAYTNLDEVTQIDRAEFNSNVNRYLDAKVALLNAIDTKAGKTADWSGVTGEGKPEDGATVGAPSGTPVGSSTADEVVSRIQAAHDAIDDIDELTQGIIDKLGDLPDDATVAESIRNIGVASDLGGNLLTNSDFATGGDKTNFPGWGLVSNSPQFYAWGVDNANQRVQATHYMGLLCTEKNGSLSADVVSDWVAVEPGKWMQASAWLASRECTASIRLQWGTDNNTFLADAAGSETIPPNTYFGTDNLTGWKRVWAKDLVPANARFARMVFSKGPYLSIPDRNDLSWSFMLRPQICLASQNQTEPSPYRPTGGGAGLAAAQAYIKSVETVAAGANSAAAQRLDSLEASVGGANGLTARLTTTEQVAVNAGNAASGAQGTANAANGKADTALDRTSGARWSKEAVAGDGRAQLTVYAFDNNGNIQAGVDIIGNVTISGDLTVDGTIRTSKMASNAAQSVQFAKTSGQQNLPLSQYSRIVQLTFEKFVQESSIDLYANIRMRSGDDIVGSFRLLNLNNGATEDTWPIWMVGANNNFQQPLALNWIATGWAPGTYTLAIEFFNQENDALVYSEPGSIIKVHEIKR